MIVDSRGAVSQLAKAPGLTQLAAESGRVTTVGCFHG